MAYRDLGAALDRIERLEAALRDGSAPKRPLPWLKLLVLMLLVLGASAILAGSWLLYAWR